MPIMSRKKPTGAPKTWRKATRLNPMQRFKMYNPLCMEYTNVATGKLKRNISFGLDRNKQHQLQKLELNRIKKSKVAMTKSIASTMNSAAGSIKTSGAEKTFEISQEFIEDSVNLNTSKKLFSLALTEYGPYTMDYTRNGQYLALCGAKGHLSIIRWQDFRLLSEEYFAINSDYIHDVKFAMNESMLCVAQREGVYIYNTKCVETHVLRRSMPFPLALEYLPYHFLLCSIGMKGKLVYFDISIGKKISTRNTNLSKCDVITQNPKNGVIHLGHNNGTVTLWTPTNENAIARVLCHKSRIRAVAVSHIGNEMATSDENGHLKIWDLRQCFKPMIEYKSNSAICNLDYSQKGLLAFSTGKSVVIWNLKNSFKPCDNQGKNELLRSRHQHLYLQHSMDRRLVSSMQFCPYQDVLGCATTKGFTSIIVPGSGEPNYDLFENDPFQRKVQRNDKIVYQLLDKLKPEMIQIDPNFIANTPRKQSRLVQHKNSERKKQNELKWARKNVTKNVKRGYKGVLAKRYSKFHHMKDLHLRQQKMIKLLNQRKKIHSNEAREVSINKKEKIIKHLGGRKREALPSALTRFSTRQSTNHQQFKSKWRRRAKKIHF